MSALSSAPTELPESFTFYQRIPPIKRLVDLTESANYLDVPGDWLIALCDVVNSTGAIEEGRYKDVNAIAAAAITAMLNETPDVEIPFVFGGDGATILIPPQIVHHAWHALLATQKVAAEAFNLKLRIGLVPVEEVRAAGLDLKVAKLFVSENYQQAIFAGGGVAYAEKLIKDPARGQHYLLDVPGEYTADFTGFECRWNKVPSKHGETLSLLVSASSNDPETRNRIYREVLTEIEAIYGDTATRNPISVRGLRLAFWPRAYEVESKIRYGGARPLKTLRLAVLTNFARLWMRFNIAGWGGYKPLFVATTDHEKFDDMLRMTISGSADCRQRLASYLDKKRKRGELFYGMHTASYALVTCIIFNYFGRQVHFVDGADGGYAMAAKAMKEQMAETIPFFEERQQLETAATSRALLRNPFNRQARAQVSVEK
jgi:hypothetical protein